jgi:hypothetical protein
LKTKIKNQKTRKLIDMADYIPKRKVKKSYYLELKKANEEYESTLDIWGSIDGSDEKVRKIKARKIVEANPELSLFRRILTTPAHRSEDKVSEGLRYWIMKENGTLPIKTKETFSILEPIEENIVLEESGLNLDVSGIMTKEVSLTNKITTQAANEDKHKTKKPKTTLSNKVAKFFGF